MRWINYKDIPDVGGFSNLFTDYLSDFKKVQQFYEWDFRQINNFKLRCNKIRNDYKHRNSIYEVLLRQNKSFGCLENTFFNLENLHSENTFAVVSGQQVGLFGGPLYTIYKIITLLKLTEHLNHTFPEIHFVPIFWLEGEDHDYDEVNKIKVISSDNQIKTLDYHVKIKSGHHGPVGSYTLENMLDIHKRLQSALPNTEFKSKLLEIAETSYSDGSTFEKSFVKLINELFPEAGIIFISSNDKAVKKLLTDIFQKEITNHPKTCQLVIQRSAELEHKYHAQVKPRALNLFLFHKGGRYLIEPKENGFSLKGTRKIITKEEMEQIVNDTPELLSPNVVLRPICQDSILPTAVYVGGPSEIAYFAQLKPIYELFQIGMPILYPRASATIVEEKVTKILDKYELDILNILNDIGKVKKQVINLVSEIKIDDLFTESKSRINDVLNEMKFGLGYIDQTLLGALENTREKIASNLNSLKEKTDLAQKQKHETALRQVEKAFNNLMPDEILQERELHIFTYMNKYGLEFHKYLAKEIQIDKFEHQIFDL